MATTFKVAAGQTAFTTAVQTADYEVSYPFGANEPTAIVIKAPFMQTRADYARPAANTTLTYGSATAYFIDDSDFRDERGGVCTWTRTWATIPATWSEPGGSIAYTFPAYTVGIAFGSIYPVTGFYQWNATTVICNTNATGVSAADMCFLDVNYIRANQNYHITTVERASYVQSGTYIAFLPVLPGSGVWTDVTGTVRAGNLGRSAAETIEVDSRLIHEYVLSAETTVNIDLPQVDKFSPVNSSGYEVSTLSTGTATIPNSASYASMVAAGTEIVAARSERSRYLGNIYCRTTRLVKAR